jgi:hypothetical protein
LRLAAGRKHHRSAGDLMGRITVIRLPARRLDGSCCAIPGHEPMIGSPHLGAPLTRAAGLAGWALGLAPETRPFAALAAGPASVKDLRHGYVLDDDWTGCDQDCCDHRSDAPLLAGANHYATSATVTADPSSPLGAVVGDLLVQPASAHGRRGPRQHIPFPVQTGRGLGGMHHFDLLNHPDVWEAMRGLLRQTAH